MTVSSNLFAFDRDTLRAIAERESRGYASARPFPHVVLDDLVPPAIIDACVQEFPGVDAIRWERFTDGGRTEKLATNDERDMGPVTRQLIREMNSRDFISFLEALTGISGLVPDPHLLGGGLHLIEPGGFLELHADFNRHPHLALDRRLNLLLYLNDGWRDEWRGHLELWDRDRRERVSRIAPIANRCVVFSTTDDAVHGHPEPVASPPGTTRKSIALYYYTAGRPERERSPDHSTIYLSGGSIASPKTTGNRSRVRSLAHALLPPILTATIQRWRRRRAASS